jgi:hypothetical protein
MSRRNRKKNVLVAVAVVVVVLGMVVNIRRKKGPNYWRNEKS